jgi:hypothetical protein
MIVSKLSDITQEEQEDFWNKVKWTVSNLMNSDEVVVDHYRLILYDAPEAEQLLVLHDEPLNIASELTNTEITPEKIEQYLYFIERRDYTNRNKIN